jgi:hypothetical protein
MHCCKLLWVQLRWLLYCLSSRRKYWFSPNKFPRISLCIPALLHITILIVYQSNFDWHLRMRNRLLDNDLRDEMVNEAKRICFASFSWYMTSNTSIYIYTSICTLRYYCMTPPTELWRKLDQSILFVQWTTNEAPT